VLKIRVKATTTVNQGTTASNKSKTAYSNELFVHAATPTVSYRKNRVGINYGFPNNNFDDAAFVVRPYGDESLKIYFSNAEGNQSITINLENHSIDGAIIDGGTWS
jgi:hypothetical protein